ncbi:hypothetical protein HCN44_009541 [Aphidius gifuensis]|uniref:Estradiol 17-beta-dehydrogenase 12 n=1 Tax=Aphidius gifuensis TaxID=684658 RepID=A0A834Y2K3_APHGI|nr:very-long-chain 3-oxoacyl-CoA reductase-like [Aphidius gifuensis]KAF7998143.1 hypothetical protein HCN44_009541 [Aphidius gifuensis]
MSFLCWMIIVTIKLRIIIHLSVFIWKKLIAPSIGLGLDVATQGRWAVVTGATDGIGKAFAEALAAKGLDIVLVSRSLEKLENVSTEIKAAYGVSTKIVEADLTEGQQVYDKIAKAIDKLEIGVLVNNAGVGYNLLETFNNVSEELIANLLQVNIAATTFITKIILPGMVKRKKGVVINISSTSAAIPSPYLSVYAASKAFVDKLSADLAAEAAPHGVTVQCVLPGPVATKMIKKKQGTWMAPTPKIFVNACLKTVGIESRTTGYLPHYLIVGIFDSLNYICEKIAVWFASKIAINIRNRTLLKIKQKHSKLN